MIPSVRRSHGQRSWSKSLSLVAFAVAALIAAAAGAPPAHAQLTRCVDFEQVFGYPSKEPPKGFNVVCLGSNAPGNVFWPGGAATFEFQIVNLTDQPLKASGHWEIIQYATRSQPLDSFAPPTVTKIGETVSIPASVEIAPNGFVNPTVTLPLAAEFGAYAVVLDLAGEGRKVAATAIRTLAATSGNVQYPAYACDIRQPEEAPFFQRIGVQGTRIEWGAFKPDNAGQWDRMDEYMKVMSDAGVTVMLTLSTGGDYSRMPLGRIRGFLNDQDEAKMDYPGDFTALPQYDEDFQQWVRLVTERYGWPKGPVNAVELWNEPWEGISISGWGADLPRYRELYTRMAQGVEEARKNAGVQVLIGGTCSSMNTEDKLFPDGKDEPFLKWLDFTSIHYQPMCPEPVLIKRFAQRKSPLGPTRVWDTETWMANSEDRVAGLIASMRASGLDRTAGVLHEAVREARQVDVRQQEDPDQAKAADKGKGSKGKAQKNRKFVVQALAPAAALAPVNAYMGQRPFKEVLFKNGLPWVFVFNGLKNEDDGTVVVMGDLGAVYERDLLLMRGVLGFEARKRGAEVRAQMAALPADAPVKQRSALLNTLRIAEVLDSASMTLSDGGGHFVPLDCYGNPVKSAGGKIVVPLSGLSYFLRTDGSPGSFAKLIEAIKTSQITGYEPVDIIAHDLLGRLESKPKLRLTLANVLNRPLSGNLNVKLGSLQLDAPTQSLTLAPHETKEISLAVTGGQPSADNTYLLSVVFDAGPDGRKSHEEPLHVNVIARKTVNVDGNLDDWKDVLPQPIQSGTGPAKNLTEKAWLPFVKYEDSVGQGFASGYLAYDEKNFYFAAKIADSSPSEGNVRMATRDDDAFFYPETVWDINPKSGKPSRVELHWPAGVRHYSYRKNPALPTGDGENVQIGFNVLPVEATDWLSHPPGTMPRFACYKSTDYEYALNQVAEQYGGGTEIWRLLAPGMPRKHFYPRQPQATAPAKEGGPVTDGRLSVKRDGNTRLVECAIPWSEIPDVKRKLDANEPIKFTFRVNENKAASYESNQNRSVSKADTYALHNYWQSSWAVETEFAFEK